MIDEGPCNDVMGRIMERLAELLVTCGSLFPGRSEFGFGVRENEQRREQLRHCISVLFRDGVQLLGCLLREGHIFKDIIFAACVRRRIKPQFLCNIVSTAFKGANRTDRGYFLLQLLLLFGTVRCRRRWDIRGATGLDKRYDE